MYPRLIVDLEKLKHNTEFLVNKLYPIKVMGVTKVFCAMEEAVKAMIDGGISFVADSRIDNLEKISTDLPKVLLRIPMQSELDRVVQVTDIVLISEMDTIKKLNNEAKLHNKKIKIILMFDLGDLREGIWFEEELNFIEEILDLDNLSLYGIGTNLTCYGGIIPNRKHLELLNELREAIESKGAKIEVISGGNSSSLYLEDLSLINNLRLGEAIVLGRETAFGEILDGLYDDVFTLEAEVVEVKEKPSHPVGEIGMDAFGNKPLFIDKGNIMRAIVAVGKQDVDESGLIFDGEILGASSDHLIIAGDYKVGDIIKFKLKYGALLRLATSPYVKKEVIG
ncbi:alanine/ornithine racemase family PLP-dependent enzyme [Mycoplasmatota bacterium]|nr:alanine/ornithine racemase family PLP-dependent enzyme [Mycoplasmatota bacterium]